jgi:group I intron endonuclease
MKKLIIKENENKSGIYRWTNKYTGDTYIGQSINLSARFIHCFNTSYLTSKKQLIISRALIKYGYSGFSLEILEFCEKSDLLEREQYYLDLLKPEYNILKIAGSSLGFKQSEDTKAKISKSLKGIYVGKNSALFGRVHSEETKALMSIKKLGDKNHNFGRTLSEETKELIRLRAQGRIHSEETKALISQKHGNPVNIYEKVSGEFSLIGSFVSKRKAAQFLEISAGTVTRYMQSGKLFKDKYKFSTR